MYRRAALREARADDGTLFIRVERSSSSVSTCKYNVSIAID